MDSSEGDVGRGAHPAASGGHRDPRAALEAVWRIESARVVGTLARVTGDFALAEDLAQEALAQALVSWPRDGVPDAPAAWLITVGRRRAIDSFRRQSTRADRYATLARDLAEGGAATGAGPGGGGLGGAGTGDGRDVAAAGVGASQSEGLLWDPDRIDDDVLSLVFIACHPTLSREASVALTLRVVAGLSSEEIARAFLVPTATVQARITRAKKTLSAAQVPFELPPAQERGQRLAQVLAVLNVVFTEGSTATSGGDLIRTDLAREGIRLARILAQLMPQEPEVHGLLALFELTSARFPARLARDGTPVLLDQQDRGHWDRSAIRRGRAALRRASSVGHGLGAYSLQAAIAECHALAPTFADTDWERIVVLYEALGRLTSSPIVELNRAVAVSMAEGPATALRIVDNLALSGALRESHLLPTVRAELLTRLGRLDLARVQLQHALRLCGNEAEQRVLRAKLSALRDEIQADDGFKDS